MIKLRKTTESELESINWLRSIIGVIYIFWALSFDSWTWFI